MRLDEDGEDDFQLKASVRMRERGDLSDFEWAAGFTKFPTSQAALWFSENGENIVCVEQRKNDLFKVITDRLVGDQRQH